MTFHRHPQASLEARALVAELDGSADKAVEAELTAKLSDGDIDEALELDQVRREIEKIYEAEGK